MAMLWILISIFSLITSIIISVEILPLEKWWKNVLYFLVAGALCLTFLIGFIDNDKIIKSEHVIIHQDTWGSIEFDKVKTIEYDKYTHGWWTYASMLDASLYNEKVTDWSGQ